MYQKQINGKGDLNKLQSMDNKVAIPDEILTEKIFSIRGKNVMIDKDLAELSGVETRRLKEQVRRNIYRFPEDFMIEITKEEFQVLKELKGKQSVGRHSKYPPFIYLIIKLTMILASRS